MVKFTGAATRCSCTAVVVGSALDRAGVEISILGAVEVRVDGKVVDLGGARQRAVFTLLALRANQVVSLDRLIDDVWGEQAPETAAHVVRVYVSQLRKALGPAGHAIATRPPGYTLIAAGDELDLARFERRCADAREALAGGEHARAAAELVAALGSWRGPPLADMAYESWAQPAIARLEGLRVLAVEDRIEADLGLGRHAAVVPELVELMAEYPHRERLRGQLLLALYRSGRQSEALEAYRQFRAALTAELGIEPTPPLQALNAAILRHDASLQLERASSVSAPASASSSTKPVVLAVCLEDDRLDNLAVAAKLVAAGRSAEVVLVRALEPSIAGDPVALNEPMRLVEQHRAALIAAGVAARATAFRSSDRGRDSSRLATDLDAALLLVDAPPGLADAGRLGSELRAMLATAACDVAALGPHRAAITLDADQPLIVPFGGSEHDWAALELAACLASGQGAPLRLLGVADQGRADDASRLLAAASLAVQRLVGIAAEPLFASRQIEEILQAVDGAGLIVIGLSSRSLERLGVAREAIIRRATAPTLLVRRGLRPGLIAPPTSATRFTWTLAGS